MLARLSEVAAMTLPHDNLILFDGVCNFCTSSVQFIIRHDSGAVFRFVSIQSDLGSEICRTAGLNPDDIQTFIVLTKGRALIRSDAALEVAKQFGGLWRLLVVFKMVPRGLRDWVYSFVARHRYRWFGRRDTCMIPADDVRERFLAPVIRKLSSSFFAEDFKLFQYLGVTTGWREAHNELLSFQDVNRAKPSLLRTGLKIRVSGQKAAKLAEQLFSEDER